jgi:peptidoglycan/xylan/chitin deacetylase (PgdA/CDA1 family)
MDKQLNASDRLALKTANCSKDSAVTIIHPDARPGADRGILTISIDLELAWGVCDKPITLHVRRAIDRERDIVPRILTLFSIYDIRATWAIVGHLLLTRCQWKNGIVHPEIRRPILLNSQRDWFFQHPGEGVYDRVWYARDLVDLIRDATPVQEIGSHSFCHIPYIDRVSGRNAVADDIEMARKLHESEALEFEAFVFPRNLVACKDLLRKAGIRVYRGNSPRWYDSIPWAQAKRFFNLVQFFLSLPPQTVRPSIEDSGMVNIPDSMLFIGRKGIRRFITRNSLIKMGIVGLNRAVQSGEVFHLWFHPSNFSYETEEQFFAFEAILKHSRKLREEGQLQVLTMGDLGKRISDPARQEQ